MKTFVKFMADRVRLIQDGHFDPVNATRTTLVEKVNAANVAARRTPSDPFTFTRALNLLQKGIYTPEELRGANLTV